jgi:hypothetical protein
VSRVYWLLFFLSFCNTLSAQSDDSTLVETNDTVTTASDYDNIVLHAQPDSTVITDRQFNNSVVAKLKADTNLQYKEPPTVAESLWDRLLAWIVGLFRELIDKSLNTSWGNVIVYLIALSVAIVLVMVALKINAFKILFSAEGKSAIGPTVLDENIHEMDFEKLIKEAIESNDLRKAVRLIFLFSLKILSDKQYIRWESGKTNRDYVNELNLPEIQSGFNELNFYFEYTWYGNFNITKDTFAKMQNTFASWRDNVK